MNQGTISMSSLHAAITRQEQVRLIFHACMFQLISWNDHTTNKTDIIHDTFHFTKFYSIFQSHYELVSSCLIGNRSCTTV